MMIRRRGSKIQLLRVSYSPLKKRSQDTFVASLDSYASSIPQGVRTLLTEKEITQVENYLAEKLKALRDSTLSGSLTMLPKTIERAVEALEDPALCSHLSQESASQIWDSLDKIRRSMRKAGFSKPRAAEPHKTI